MTLSQDETTTAMSARPTFTIRALEPADFIADLTALLHRAYKGLADQGLRYLATHQSDEMTLKRASQGECYVAMTDGVLCGTILFKPAAQTKGCPWYDREDVACFGQFAVEPDLQSQGLGADWLSLSRNVPWQRERESLHSIRQNPPPISCPGTTGLAFASSSMRNGRTPTTAASS